MRHEKRSLGTINSNFDVEEPLDEDAEPPRRRRTPQTVTALPDLEDSTATPSRSSSNQLSRRSSGQDGQLSRHSTDEAVSGESVFPIVHVGRHRGIRPKRILVTDESAFGEKPGWPNVFPGRGVGRGPSPSEPENQSRSSSLGSAGYGSSSSLGPCATEGSSVTPRQRRTRSRSGSGCESCSLSDLRDHLSHHIRGPPAGYHDIIGNSYKALPPPPPASPTMSPTKRRARASSSYSSEQSWGDSGRAMSFSASASALLAPSCSDDSPETGRPSSRSANQGGFNQRRTGGYGVKLPMLTHSESAPLFTAPVHRSSPRKGEPRRSALGRSLRETSVDEKEDDLEVVDLALSAAAVVASNSTRPVTAWGTGRPRTRGSDSDTQRPNTRGTLSDTQRPDTRGSTRDGWQLSLCQSVAIHCPSSLPSKETFAQRKVPRPVSPLPDGGDSQPASSTQMVSQTADVPSFHASIGDLLQNMRRMSDENSSVHSGSDCGSNSAECNTQRHAVDLE